MTDERNPGELGAFLKACRARVAPEQAGLTPYGNQRRVPGLRREELAQLAGVSPSYYARLEQGHSRHASPQVANAIATALELSDDERQHLLALAAASGRTRTLRAPAVEHADAALLELLGALGEVPAIILGRRTDVLAWNPMGHALFAGHLDPASAALPGRRPNMTEAIFLDPETRALYADWPAKARAVVGNLRYVAGVHPDDPALAALIGKLTIASPEFHAMWAEQQVQACSSAVYDMHHPQAGRLTVTQQTLRCVDLPGQALVTCTVAPGSASANALAILAHVTYQNAQTTSAAARAR